MSGIPTPLNTPLVTGTQAVTGAAIGSSLKSILVAADGVTTLLFANEAAQDGNAVPGSAQLGVAGFDQLWNGTTFDRKPGTLTGQLIAPAARTTLATSSIQTNAGARGVVLRLKITVAPNTAETLTARLYHALAFSPAAGQQYASMASGAGSTMQAGGPWYFDLWVAPGLSGAADNATSNKIVSLVLPRLWFADVNPSGASSWNYELDFALLV